MTDVELLTIAKKASEKSYSPYSKFAVGAALECKGGLVFTAVISKTALWATPSVPSVPPASRR